MTKTALRSKALYFLVALFIACGRVVPEVGEEAYETVFRHYFSAISLYERREGQPVARHFFISIEGKDPSPSLLRNCNSASLTVHPLSNWNRSKDAARINIVAISREKDGYLAKVMTELPNGHAEWSNGVYFAWKNSGWVITGSPPNAVLSGKDIRRLFK